MTLRELPPHPDYEPPGEFAGPDHPIRKLTVGVASGDGWTADNAAFLTSVFDERAESWSQDHVDPVKAAPLLDAIERGGAPTDGRWIELGSGTGAGWFAVAHRVAEHLSFDLSYEMLSYAPKESPRAQADSSLLPIADDSADVVLMINMILFADEVDRILRPGGSVVWVNTLGDQTPIHLPPTDVAAALPGEWTGTTSYAGTGLWAVLHRSD